MHVFNKLIKDYYIFLIVIYTMSNITGFPIFPHSYTLYISGTTPVLLEENTYNTIIQIDNNNVNITLPNSLKQMNSSDLSFTSGGGQITINAFLGDTINGSTTYVIPASGSCTLHLDKSTQRWFVLFNGSSGSSNFPLPEISQMIYVNALGSDITGDGTIVKPFATVSHSMTTITDASWEKRYLINVGPGNYIDDIVWKAWVFVNGMIPGTTRLGGNVSINDPSWNVPGSHFDERGGAINISFTGFVVLDFTAQNSDYGKFYFWTCNNNNNMVAVGQNPINQIYIQGGQWFNGINYSGINLTINGSIVYGTIMLNPSTTAAVFTGVGGMMYGNLEIDSTGGTGITGSLFNFYVSGNINLTGINTYVTATSSSVPFSNNVIVSYNAAFVRLNDAFSLYYTGSNGSWATTLTNVQDALDKLAAQVVILSGGTPIP